LNNNPIITKNENSISKEIECQNIIKNFKYNYDDKLDIIDNDIYQDINIFTSKSQNKSNNKNISKEKRDKDEIKLNDILLPLFPNEKVFYSEFNSDKIFLLDKFIAKANDKQKKKQKNKIVNKDLNEENLLLENQIISQKNKLYKKEKESSIINRLKANKSLDYNSIFNVMTPLWQNYLKALLNKNQNLETIFSKMVKADLHGALIKVCESVNINNVGIEGINLLETKRTFCLLNKKNEIKIILKKGSVFALDISFAYEESNKLNDKNNVSFQNTDNTKIKLPMIVKIIGDNFMYKSSFRTKAKYKNRYVL
jgi:RNase P/RNase MRP subunit p29